MKCPVNDKNELNIANKQRNAPENQTWRIMMIEYHGIKVGGEAMKTPSIGVRFATSPFGTMILLVRCYGFQGAIIVTCANNNHFFHGVSRSRHDDTLLFGIS